MPKRPSLDIAVIAQAAGSRRRSPPPPTSPSSIPIDDDRRASSRPRSRRATRQVAAHFPEEVAWQLRELAVERRMTIQALLGEALNDLFQKYGKPEIVPIERETKP